MSGNSNTLPNEMSAEAFFAAAAKNPSAFASNRFSDTGLVKTICDKLADQFRAKVTIAEIYSEQDRIESEGGPYAATMIVVVPASKKVPFLEYVAGALRPDEFDLIGEGAYRLWWD